MVRDKSHDKNNINHPKKLKQYSPEFRCEVLKLAEHISIAAISCTLTVLQLRQLTAK
uniref:Mobile element protein n=1 Tax=Escherichia coli TaxID=562 RepID=A0A7U1E1D0_ECOLX|nr:Mobile element protein [Escherichia coli]